MVSRNAMLGLAAAALAAAVMFSAPQRTFSRYVIVSGDSSMSGSWDSSGEPRIEDLRAKYGARFAWFRQDGHEYVVTSGEVLAEADNAMAPQREVNRQQGEVNRHQSEVNRMQSGVNGQQRDVNRDQAEVNRRQAEVNRGQGSQSEVNRLQSHVNAEQNDVNGEQRKVNQEQAVVNREQNDVNRMQTRASAEVETALQQIFDSAITRGLAKEIR